MNGQQTSYLLLRGNQNRQIHIQVTPQPTTILQVPVLYEQGYYVEEHCHCDDRYNDEARKRYVVESMTKGITDLGVSIAELITVCKNNKEKKAAAKAEAENKQLETANQQKLDAVKAQISEASKKLEALGSATPTGGASPVDKTTPTGGASPVDKTTPTGGASPVDKTTPTGGASPVSETKPTQNSGDKSFSEKWKKVDIEYKPQCENYIKTVKSFNSTDQAIVGAQLLSIYDEAKDGIKEINEYLKGDNVTAEEKKIGKEALNKLEEIQKEIKDALSTKEPEKGEEIPSEYNGKSKFNSIDEAKKAAEMANNKYNSTKLPIDQKEAIIAYNEYAKTVLDGSKNKNFSGKEYLAKVQECEQKMNFLVYFNKSSYVKDQIEESKKLKNELWNLNLKLSKEYDENYKDEYSLSNLLLSNLE